MNVPCPNNYHYNSPSVVMCVMFGDWGIVGIPTFLNRLQCGFLIDKYGCLVILRPYYKYILYSFL